ncbi:MAG: site-specific DNA-methyltransferase, partial [Rhodocyclaceae bacterium]|nr:site-specific DNA-methyltransferase [Rhodocyclaceae bacterium]
MSAKWLAERIEHWPLDRLIPYARNARTHSEEQIAAIAGSIAEFGFTNPILVGEDGTIVAGHGRLAAARKLGLESVPVIVLDHLSPTQRRALVLADNRLAELAGWDAEMLGAEIEALREEGWRIEDLGFDEAALAALLGEDEPTREGLTDEDEAPEPPKQAVTRAGDVWVLGEHRLVCADATRAEAYAALFAPHERAQLLWTDPPYNVAYASDGHQPTIARRPIANDALGEDFEPFLRDALALALAHTEGACYIAMSSSELHTLRKVFEELGGHWSTYIIWAKDVFTLGRADYQRQYEPILYGWPKGAKRHWCGDRDQGDVWQIKKPQRNLSLIHI